MLIWDHWSPFTALIAYLYLLHHIFAYITYITHIQLTKMLSIARPSPYSKKLIHPQLFSLNINIITQNSLHFSSARTVFISSWKSL